MSKLDERDLIILKRMIQNTIDIWIATHAETEGQPNDLTEMIYDALNEMSVAELELLERP